MVVTADAAGGGGGGVFLYAAAAARISPHCNTYVVMALASSNAD